MNPNPALAAPIDDAACRALAADATRQHGNAVEFRGRVALMNGIDAARFRLHNGLTLLVLPDPAAPIFAYQTWFNVGSRHEKRGKTGIAHLFEHLMFKGTKAHPIGEFDHEMERRGGQTNAATWVDWTFYRESLPTTGDNFDAVVMYESDRMVNLALTQAMVDSEREVVKNERRQRVDDSIHGALDEVTYRTAFTTHSYGHPTIGYMDDLNGMTLAEFETFYRAYYAPNNAVVVVSGDLSLERIVHGVCKAYGAIPAQPVPAPPDAAEPAQHEVRRAELRRPTDSERVAMVFHGPGQSAPEHAALQVAGEILCGGETGRIYDDLVVQRELCQEAHASVTPFKEPGLFQLDLAMKPDVPHKEAEALALAHLERLGKDGPDAGELSKTKNRIESGFLRALLDVDGKAEQLGHYEITAGDAGFLATALDRLRRVTATDVQQAVRTYLNPNARTVVCVLPEE